MRLIPRIMRPNQGNNRVLSADPMQAALLKMEQKADAGLDVKLKDVEIKWKFVVSQDPNRGINFETYKDTGFETPSFDAMLERKNLKKDLEIIQRKSRASQKKANIGGIHTL